MTWCSIGVHRWAKWIDGTSYVQKYRTTDPTMWIEGRESEWHTVKHFMVQTRQCDECGKKESRKVTV